MEIPIVTDRLEPVEGPPYVFCPVCHQYLEAISPARPHRREIRPLLVASAVPFYRYELPDLLGWIGQPCGHAWGGSAEINYIGLVVEWFDSRVLDRSGLEARPPVEHRILSWKTRTWGR